MADTSYSDLGLVYNHPSIISTITNNDTIFTSTSGNRPFYCVIASERGEDNKIKMISSVKEFLFEYGDPNLKLYGQQNYNILNILQNGETVYVLRVLPDNAGYSHAMLNLQTKKNGTKLVKGGNGDLVNVDDIFIRPTVTYSKANNSSKTLLEYELKNNDAETIDGYKNNPLFFVVPKGRGKYYDSFGFRIYLNKSYDNSYDFRVYNFEVIQYDEYDNPSIVEGPFYVSLDPDALTESNQSMFIEDVVNRYSQYLNVIFNEEAYDYVTGLINSDVNPGHLDILSGITREVDNEPETFFDEKTMTYQDVHYRLFEYDDFGEIITNGVNPFTNFINDGDDVEAEIIALDNTARNKDYELANETLENIKEGIISLSNGRYLTDLNEKMKTIKSNLSKSTSTADYSYSKIINTEIPKYNGIKNKESSDYSNLLNIMSKLEGSVEDLITDLTFVKDSVSLVDTDSPDILLQITTFISTVRKLINSKDTIAIRLISYESVISNILKKVPEIEALQNMEDEVSEMKILLTEIRNMVNYLIKILPNYDEMKVGSNDTLNGYKTNTNLTNKLPGYKYKVEGNADYFGFTGANLANRFTTTGIMLGTGAEGTYLTISINGEVIHNHVGTSVCTDEIITYAEIEKLGEVDIVIDFEAGGNQLNNGTMKLYFAKSNINTTEKYILAKRIQQQYDAIIDNIAFIDEEFNPEKYKEDKLLDIYNIINGSNKTESSFISDVTQFLYLLILSNEEKLLTDLFGKSVKDENGDIISNSSYSTYKGYLGATTILEIGRIERVSELYDITDTESINNFVKNAKDKASIQKDKVNESKNIIYTTQLQNIDLPIRFKFGSEGDLDDSNLVLKNKTFDNLLIKGYRGTIDDGITSKKIIPARFIIDANYSINVKNAMHLLATEIRDDIFFYCDLGFTASPEDALSIRNTQVNFSANTIAIYGQDFTVYDEYTGRDIRVTTPYFLSSKIPYCSINYGLHYPIAGNRRGLLDGFKSISWTPNEAYKELLYNKKINYIESDTTKTRFGSQLTSEMRNTPLSNINNVITVIDIKNDVELLAENYQFEFNESETINAFQSELNSYLSKYTSSKAAERIDASVYSSDYDKLQKILRVSITIKFYDIIERILINLDVVKQ